jgi:hypothetical protein
MPQVWQLLGLQPNLTLVTSTYKEVILPPHLPSLQKTHNITIIYNNYINESASTNFLNMRAIHLSCPIIATSPLKNAKKLK